MWGKAAVSAGADIGMSVSAKALFQQWEDASKSSYMPARIMAIRVMGERPEEYKEWLLACASESAKQVRGFLRTIYTKHREWEEDILEMLKSSKGICREMAVEVLQSWGAEQYGQAFEQAFRQVKSAAAQALDYAAEQLGISREDLEDRIVPNLGFDQRMERIFDYGKRQFRVLLNTNLSLEVYASNGKKLKNLPAPGKTDDPDLSKEANEAWKLLKKQLKTVVTNQKTRLEQALRISRQWEPEKWKELFVENPVMHQFAMGLIWGVYLRLSGILMICLKDRRGGMTLVLK